MFSTAGKCVSEYIDYLLLKEKYQTVFPKRKAITVIDECSL